LPPVRFRDIFELFRQEIDSGHYSFHFRDLGKENEKPTKQLSFSINTRIAGN